MTIRIFVPLIFVATLPHLLDALTTAIGIGQGIPEGNPVQLVVFQHAGLFGMDLIKLALVSVCIVLLWRVRLRYQSWQVWIAVLCLALPAVLVTVLNLQTILGA